MPLIRPRRLRLRAQSAAVLVGVLLVALAAVLGESVTTSDPTERLHQPHDLGPNELALVPSGFTIAGEATERLRPGSASGLLLTIDNPYDFPLAVQDISVTFVGTPECDGPSNFVVSRPFVGPVTVPSGASTLPTDLAPQIAMLNLDISQDGCKAHPVTLRYGGSARRA